jgi:hypothetical protein
MALVTAADPGMLGLAVLATLAADKTAGVLGDVGRDQPVMQGA